MSVKTGSMDAWTSEAEETLVHATLDNTLAQYAIGLLVTLVVLLIAALVGGEFADALPEDGAFNESIDGMTTNAGTAFTIFGVAILIIPAVAAVVLIVRGFGGLMNGGGGMNGR